MAKTIQQKSSQSCTSCHPICGRFLSLFSSVSPVSLSLPTRSAPPSHRQPILFKVGLIFPRVMSNLRWPMTNLRNGSSSGKQPHLPPKAPSLGMLQSYADYLVGASIRSCSTPRVGESHRAHLRTSSESFLIEEQPSWLDDLLNEPETPIRRGSHRRSSSDSVAYLDTSKNVSNLSSLAQEGLKSGNLSSVTTWWSADFEHIGDFQGASSSSEVSSVERQAIKTWDLSSSSRSNASDLPSGKDNFTHTSPTISNVSPEQDAYPSTSAEKQDQVEGSQRDPKGSSYDKRDVQNAKPSAEADKKRSKQQYAQRSRVRKLQYIAELERHVQTLQAEGSGVVAEIEFLDQQNLILSMENKALKQRLDGLAQEQMIKRMEHEVLEREIARLRIGLYQLQHPQQMVQQHVQGQKQTISKHQRRSNSRDINFQFSGLSLNNKETNNDEVPVNGALHI